MESNKNVTEESKTTGGTANKPFTTTGQPFGAPGHASAAPQRARDIASDFSSGVQTAYDQTVKAVSDAPQRAREIASDVSSGVQTAYDQTVKAVGDAYEKTSEVLTNTYDQTMTYGRENPGKLTMIAFGAGIGIGILLASGLGGGRSRNSRFAEPIVGALSQVALELFR